MKGVTTSTFGDNRSNPLGGLSTSPLNRFLAVVLACTPLLHLTVKSWTNIFVGLLFILAMGTLIRDKCFLRQLNSGWETPLVFVALSAPLFGIFIAQMMRHHWFPKALDGPSRMAMMAFAFLVLKEKKSGFLSVFRWICPVSVILCFISILVFHSGTDYWGGRFATYFADCDTFGQHITLLTFLSFMMFQMEPIVSRRLLLLDLASLLAGTYMALGSQTRGAWIALLPLSLVWVYFLRRRPAKIIVSILLFGVFFWGILYFVPFLKDRFISIYHELHGWFTHQNMDTSGGLRLSMWKITLALFQHSPLYGYGEYEQFKVFLEEPFITSIASKAARETINNGPHNQLAAEVLRSGIFGLLYSLGTFLIPGIVFLRNIGSKKAAVSNPAVLGLCVVVAFAVFSLAFEVFNLKFAVSFYGFLIAVLAAECLSSREEESPEPAVQPKSAEKSSA